MAGFRLRLLADGERLRDPGVVELFPNWVVSVDRI